MYSCTRRIPISYGQLQNQRLQKRKGHSDFTQRAATASQVPGNASRYEWALEHQANAGLQAWDPPDSWKLSSCFCLICDDDTELR